jgi:hypothetical protein
MTVAKTQKDELHRLRDRLFGVGCDAEDGERWYDAYCIFEYLAALEPRNVVVALHLARVAVELGHYSHAVKAMANLDRALTSLKPEPPHSLSSDVESVRLRFESLLNHRD